MLSRRIICKHWGLFQCLGKFWTLGYNNVCYLECWRLIICSLLEKPDKCLAIIWLFTKGIEAQKALESQQDYSLTKHYSVLKWINYS